MEPTEKNYTDTEQATNPQQQPQNPEQKKKEASYTYWVKNNKEQFP